MTLEERHERLLDAASEVFGVSSSAEKSLNAIARATGIAKASIYELFPSRDALFAAAVAREFDRLVEYMLDVYRSANGSPRERTRARVSAIFGYAAEHPDRMRVIMVARHQRDAAIEAQEAGARRRIAARLREVLEEELAALGTPATAEALDVLAVFLVDTTANMALRVLEEDSWSPAEVERLVADFVFAGLSQLPSYALRDR
jgi:AcrR family transcriptional regulator